MRVTFVMGIPGSGKSHFIKTTFDSKTKVIDLYDFQKNKNCSYDDIWQSYQECQQALVNACKEGYENIILEHTMFKKCRRIPYIEAVRTVTNCPIDMVFICPSFDILVERQKQRGIYVSDKYIEDNLDVIEFPTKDEGYATIMVVTE